MTSVGKRSYPNLEEEQTEQLVEQQRPQLPPRITNVQSSPAPYVPNQNIFAVLLKNARQISSLTAGECVYVHVCVCVYVCTICAHARARTFAAALCVVRSRLTSRGLTQNERNTNI